MGLVVLKDMRRSEQANWEDGKIYNPDDGKEYEAVMSLQRDGSLRANNPPRTILRRRVFLTTMSAIGRRGRSTYR